MIKISKAELLKTKGGSISGSLVNAFARAIDSLLGLGRSLGTAVRRINDNKLCRYER